MTKWLLNSAVIAAGAYGAYEYAPATAEDLREFMRDGQYVSRIGYPETAQVIAVLSGLPAPEISRETSEMQVGDEAMIVRLRYRIGDPRTKGHATGANPDAWEIARLKRTT